MSQARFATVQDLFDNYPSASADIGSADQTMRSMDFLRATAGNRDWEAAISFCAYYLPRRLAVAWACRSIRRMMPGLRPDEERMLEFAEAWIEEPVEQRRRKVLALGTVGDTKSPTTWAALAAGWSGGSVVPEDMGHVSADPEQTAKAVRAALLIALSQLKGEAKHRIMSVCCHDGLELAGGNPTSPR
jgi:hypothetical protein